MSHVGGVCFSFVLYIAIAKAAKQRSWLGPTDFYEGVVPSPRCEHGLASVGNEIYVFGGFNTDGMASIHKFAKSSQELQTILNIDVYVGTGFLNDLHSFDTNFLRWTELTGLVQGSAPTPRGSMGFISIQNEMIYMYGGTNGPGWLPKKNCMNGSSQLSK